MTLFPVLVACKISCFIEMMSRKECRAKKIAIILVHGSDVEVAFSDD